MTSPQKEDGYTPIANEIMDAFAKAYIPCEEMKCLWVILRNTYGWSKKEDAISMSQFSQKTGLKRPNVARALKWLLSKKIIGVIKGDNSSANLYWFIKHYESWGVLSRRIPGVITHAKKVLSPTIHTKTIYTKTNNTLCAGVITHDNRQRFENIWSRYPKRIGKKQAFKHFMASVKTEEDWVNINKALKNYLLSEPVSRGFIQNGSTWFNNWQDWVDNPIQKPEEKNPYRGLFQQRKI